MKTVQFLQQYYCKLFLCCMQDLIGCTGKKIMIQYLAYPTKTQGRPECRMQTLQFFGILTVMIEKRKQGKAGKRMGISHEYQFHPWPETAQQGRHRPAAGGNHCSNLTAVAGHHGHSGKWRKAERGCPAKPGGGHSGQYPGSAAHAGGYGSLAADSAGGTAGGGSGTADAAAVTLEQFGPARQAAGAYQVKAYDSSVIRQPGCGQVDLSYFSMRPCWATA